MTGKQISHNAEILKIAPYMLKNSIKTNKNMLKNRRGGWFDEKSFTSFCSIVIWVFYESGNT